MKILDLPAAKTYPDANECIYCGSIEPPLTLEHLIPYALGGDLKLPKASCGKCQKLTCWAEDACLRKMFLAPRTHLNARTRRKKNRPATLKMGVFDGTDGELPEDMEKANFRWKELPVEEHPIIIALPILSEPGLITGIRYGEGLAVIGMEPRVLRPPPIPKLGEQHVEMQPFSTEAFPRMLAKIAHGLAIAEIGKKAFHPMLPDFILGRRFDYSNVMGSSPLGRMHRDRLVTCSLHKDRHHLIARIQLFATLGFRPYNIVVGKLLGARAHSHSFTRPWA